MQQDKNFDYSIGFGELIKRERTTQNMKSKDLADIAGVSPAYISKIESGENKQPSFQIVLSLINALHLNWKEIYSAFELNTESLPNTYIEYTVEELFKKFEVISKNWFSSKRGEYLEKVTLTYKEKEVMSKIVEAVCEIKHTPEYRIEVYSEIMRLIEEFCKINILR